MSTKVIFTYSDEHRRWFVTVEGEKEEQKAREAFAAVVMCGQTLSAEVQARVAAVKDTGKCTKEAGQDATPIFEVIPAISFDSLIQSIIRASGAVQDSDPHGTGQSGVDPTQN